MKTLFLVAAAALSMVATAGSSRADDDGRGCSNATLKGRYGVATHGERLGVYGKETAPAIHFYTGPSGDRAPIRIDELTNETFDGHGNATQLEYVFVGGSDQTNGFVGPATGAYQVNSDCTGTEMLSYANGFEIDRAFVLSNEGKTIHILTTKIHTSFLPPPISAGVDCSHGCDLANQLFADGERF